MAKSDTKNVDGSWTKSKWIIKDKNNNILKETFSENVAKFSTKYEFKDATYSLVKQIITKKLCKKCNQEKFFTEFQINLKGSFELESTCKVCKSIYDKNPDRANKRKQSRKEWDKNRTKIVRQYKESCVCTDCGIKFPYYIMQYDHMSEWGKKEFNLSNIPNNKSQFDIAAEIMKCCVVCANCHAQRTHDRLHGINPIDKMKETCKQLHLSQYGQEI